MGAKLGIFLINFDFVILRFCHNSAYIMFIKLVKLNVLVSCFILNIASTNFLLK